MLHINTYFGVKIQMTVKLENSINLVLGFQTHSFNNSI